MVVGSIVMMLLEDPDWRRREHARVRERRRRWVKSHRSDRIVTLVITAIVAFLGGAIGGFWLLAVLWTRFNTVAQDEMSQGITGSMFGLFVALPLAICV